MQLTFQSQKTRKTSRTISLAFLIALLMMILVCSGCGNMVVQSGGDEQQNPTTIVLHAGSPAVIQKNVILPCKRLKDPAGAPTTDFDIGGWVVMPPDHWDYLRSEFLRLKKACGEPTKSSADLVGSRSSTSIGRSASK